jgi:PPOX class probable F420-dependent enzyme
MRLDADEARRRFGAARVARLATADADGAPHLVPIVFALVSAMGGDVVYSAVDAKPKRSTALRRLANVAVNPRVAVLADHYDEDWTALWWVRADGRARILEPGHTTALTALAARYPQYRDDPPPGPVLAIDVGTWTGWAAR